MFTYRRMDFSGKDLSGSDLRNEDLAYANLLDADLSGADLRRADLRQADLRGANLTGANLEETRLAGEYIRYSVLTGTCLDPTAKVPDAREAVLNAGMTIDADGFVHGWRTIRSLCAGNTLYTEGRYEAPVFSVSTESECHPGIYFAAKEWLRDKYGPDITLVQVMVRLSVIVAAGDKFRAKEVWVV